ncbi:MAG: CAP domain-containing protein [Sulfurimonas sp.]
MLLFTASPEASQKNIALEYLNTFRIQSGLIPLRSDRLLDKAAISHAHYLLRQQKIGHYEKSGMKGYTGKTPSDRVIYHGYPSKDVMENVTVNVKSGKESVEKLFAAIYHRFVFLSLDKDQIGIGKALTQKQRSINKAYVYNLGSSRQSRLCKDDFLAVSGVEYMKNVCKEKRKLVPRNLYEQQKKETRLQNAKAVLYPFPGQKEVPPVFYEEYPDPLPDYSVSGYPVTVQFNPAYCKRIKMISFKLYDKYKKEVKGTRLFTHKSDPNRRLKRGEYALMPLKRLEYAAEYTVEVEAELDGRSYQKRWSFTTEIPKEKLYRITKKKSGFEFKAGESVWLYFVPGTPDDTLKRYKVRGKTKVSFYDQNTLKVTFPETYRGNITFKAGGREVIFRQKQ